MPIYVNYTTPSNCMIGTGKVQEIRQFYLNVYDSIITPRNVSSAILPSCFRQGLQAIPIDITKEFKDDSYYYFKYLPPNRVLPFLKLNFLTSPRSQVKTSGMIRRANVSGTDMSGSKQVDRGALRPCGAIVLTNVTSSIVLPGVPIYAVGGDYHPFPPQSVSV